MQNNLIFLCGPHGSGKTTLGNEVAKQNPRVMLPELYSRNVKFNTNADYRQVLKVSNRAIENFEYLQIAKQNPDKIILANRCIYDVLAYNEVYLRKGWLDNEVKKSCNLYVRDFFKNENAEPYAIVLNPGFDVVQRHLEARWIKKGKKWREDDLEYAKFACEVYEKLKDNPLVYYIGKEIDLVVRGEIKEVGEWLEGLVGVRV